MVVPVVAYDIVHQGGMGGIGNRRVSSFTSLVCLLADTQVSYGASWHCDRPSIDYRTQGPDQMPSLIAKRADGRLSLHASGQPGRIYKTIAKRAGLEMVSFDGTDTWRWEEKALADPSIYKLHGMAFFYRY